MSSIEGDTAVTTELDQDHEAQGDEERFEDGAVPQLGQLELVSLSVLLPLPSHLLVVDEASFSEVLFALLLLLGLVVCDEGCVAPLVVAVVAADLLSEGSLLDKLHLGDTSL